MFFNEEFEPVTDQRSEKTDRKFQGNELTQKIRVLNIFLRKMMNKYCLDKSFSLGVCRISKVYRPN